MPSRGRVKAARAFVSTTPGLAKILRSDWTKAARLHARFGIDETLFRHGASADTAAGNDDFFDHEAGGDQAWSER